jgi:dihydrolipoamide dehydrogenase
MTETHDVIIIGAGTAGLAALREVRKRTESFLIVNAGAYGTTCARVGCMPSKALIEAAHAFARRESFEAFGISGADALEVDVAAVLRRVRELRDDFVAGVLKTTDELGERSIAGRARLLGPDRVDVDGTEYRAKRIVLATGSSPIVPKPWKAFGDRVQTTDSLFENENLPQRIAVIGLGAIGVEVAQALAQLGLDVTGFSMDDKFAGVTDSEVRAALERRLRSDFTIHVGPAAELHESVGGLTVQSGAVSVEVDLVIAAMGRRPNVQDLGLETLGVELDESGMPPVDRTTLQVAGLPIYLAGDANGDVMILHETADEGHIAGVNAGNAEPQCFARRTPLGIVFSEPNVAFAGKRWSDLDQESIIVGRFDFARQGRARTAELNEGVVAVYADRETGKLVGAELCAPGGEHMAHLIALAIDRESTVQDFLRFPFYHPVFEEGLRSALRKLSKQLPKASESDLAACPGLSAEALD